MKVFLAFLFLLSSGAFASPSFSGDNNLVVGDIVDLSKGKSGSTFIIANFYPLESASFPDKLGFKIEEYYSPHKVLFNNHNFVLSSHMPNKDRWWGNGSVTMNVFDPYNSKPNYHQLALQIGTLFLTAKNGHYIQRNLEVIFNENSEPVVDRFSFSEILENGETNWCRGRDLYLWDRAIIQIKRNGSFVMNKVDQEKLKYLKNWNSDTVPADCGFKVPHASH